MSNNSSLVAKIALGVSMLSLLGVVYNSVKICGSGASGSCPCASGAEGPFDEKIKGSVISLFRENPQLFMDAMSDGIAKKRTEAIQQIAKDVAGKKTEIDKVAIKLGDKDSKAIVTAFLDPLCPHCIEFQKNVGKILKANTNVLFKVVPVTVLGDDSAILSAVYLAAYQKDSSKFLKFIEAITDDKNQKDKKGIEKALKDAGYDADEIEKSIEESGAKLAENNKLAEALKVPVVPFILVGSGEEAKMMQSVALDDLLNEIKAISETPTGDKK